MTGSNCISLFKFKSFDQSNPPNRLGFRHLLSCGTIEGIYSKNFSALNVRKIKVFNIIIGSLKES